MFSERILPDRRPSIRCVQPNPLNRLGLSEKLKIVTNFLRIEDATPNVLLTNTLALVRYLVVFQSQSLPCRLTKDVPKIFYCGRKTKGPEGRELGWGGVLRVGQQLPSAPASGFEEHCELLLGGGVGEEPDRPKVFHYFQHSGWHLLTLLFIVDSNGSKTSRAPFCVHP